MQKRLFIVFLSFALTILSLCPFVRILADIQLPELDVHHLLNSIQQGIIDGWIDITASQEFSEPEKQAALFLIRNAIQKRELSYAFQDLPLEVLGRVAKLAAFLYFTPDAGQILDKIEKESVKKAVKDLTDWFLQNEIKVASGKLKDSFVSFKGNRQEAVFYYNLAYHPISENKGEIAAEFYSPNEIEPFECRKVALLVIRSSVWEFETWRSQGKEKIPPFVLRVKGQVSRTLLGSYRWDKTLSIKISFNEEMPDFSQIEREEDIAKIPFLGKYYKDIKNKLEKARAIAERFGIISRLSGAKKEIIKKGNNIKNSLGNIWGKVKSYFSKINPFTPASIVENVPSGDIWTGGYPNFQNIEDYFSFQKNGSENSEAEASQEGSLKEIEEIEKQVAVVEKEIEEKSPSALQKQISKGKNPDEIQEELDNIGESIDLIAQKISDLLKKQQGPSTSSFQEVVTEKEFKEKESNQEESIEEEVAEKETEEKKFEKEKVGQVILCKKVPSYTEPVQDSVIFYEIAWMGTKKSSNDEWIELKNISNRTVDISGWQIFDKDQQIQIVFPQKTSIAPGGFYLLERTDDNSVPYIDADFIYTGALNDTNEELYLFSSECALQDRIVVRSGWMAGNKDQKRSMERNKNGYGWHTYYGPSFNEIFGTPKRENSVGIVFYGGGGASEEEMPLSETLNYSSKLLITEIQIEGENSSDDFVELYNPSTTSIDISGFQLKKKTSSGKEYSIRVFPQGSIIPANRYFIWANSDYASSSKISADATSSQTLAKNNSIALFDKNKNIIDAVAWGSSTNPFVEGEAFDKNPSQNQSLARKWSEELRRYQDTQDNSQDFEIQESTPGQKNLVSVENITPTALFDFSPRQVLAGTEVIFSAASSTDLDGEITSFLWDFGDGFSTTTCLSTTTYTYATSGVFTVTLWVVDDNFSTSSPATATIEVVSSLLEITPSVLKFDTEESKNPLSQNLTLRNTNTTSTSWTASLEYTYSTTSASTDWIVINPASGTIPVNASSTIEVSVNSSQLAVGEYYADILIFDGLVTSSVPIVLKILSPPAPSLSVVINEIAWMGTKSDVNDEWIELFNNTDKEINLDGWQLSSQDGSPSTTLSGVIPPKGYFLLERTDDNTISDIEADQIYTGALSNNGEKLELRDPVGNLVDSVDCSSGWFGGRNKEINGKWIRMSMERINPQKSGNDSSNWMTNDGFNIFGLDSEKNVLQGTPKRENSRYNYFPGSFFHYTNDPLTHDTILTKEGSPYIFRGTLYISQNSLVLIEPGVHISLVSDVTPNPSIDAEGTIIAKGTPDEPIIFGPQRDCRPQSWRYIHLKGEGSLFDNVKFRCGGCYYYLPLVPVFYKGALWVDNTTTTITNSLFENNLVAGVWLTNSNSLIKDSIFRDHNQNYGYGPPYKTSAAIRLEGNSNPVLENLTFENNTFDIYP